MFDLIPFEDRASGLFDAFDHMLRNDFFGGPEKEIVPCRTDILDKGDHYVLRADMPGFQKEDINIDIEGDRLNLSAEHKEEKKEDKDNYLRRERRYDAFSRSFDIQGIDTDRISASYNDGVLELNLPKVPENKPETRKIEIKS